VGEGEILSLGLFWRKEKLLLLSYLLLSSSAKIICTSVTR
jgi:hypothetical protein